MFFFFFVNCCCVFLWCQSGPSPFDFDSEVTAVFDDMISRSVPLYREGIDLLLSWVKRHYVPNTIVYDLGCSTGTAVDAILRCFEFQNEEESSEDEDKIRLRVVGIDTSQPMIDKARHKLAWV